MEWIWVSKSPDWLLTCRLSDHILRAHSGQTERACAIWPDLLPANYREIKKAVAKRQKVKPLLEREALSVEYLWESSCLFTSDFIASYFVLSVHF